MISFPEMLIFGLAALVMVLTPGPNMVYLVSRSLCQGPRAAVISLAGVALGFVMHMMFAAFGITAFFVAVPFAYDTLRFLGACYLLWLAWQAIRPGARGVFETRALWPDSPTRLLWMGFMTNALNPKIAVFYLSIFSQFLDPGRGSVLLQSIALGSIQIVISISVNFLIIQSAGLIALWLHQRPRWSGIQRWFMATVLGALATRMVLEERR